MIDRGAGGGKEPSISSAGLIEFTRFCLALHRTRATRIKNARTGNRPRVAEARHKETTPALTATAGAARLIASPPPSPRSIIESGGPSHLNPHTARPPPAARVLTPARGRNLQRIRFTC